MSHPHVTCINVVGFVNVPCDNMRQFLNFPLGSRRIGDFKNEIVGVGRHQHALNG